MKNGFLLPASTQDLFFHHVSSGDTLSKIITEYFPDNTHGMESHIQQVLADNPEVTNPDMIKLGQLITLREPSDLMCPTPIDQKETNYVKNLWLTMDSQTQKSVKETSPYYSGLSLGIVGGGISTFTLDKTLKSNMSLLNGIPDEFQKYKSGQITKYEFDKFRKAKLDTYTKQVGTGINKLIHSDKNLHDAFKLKPGRSLNPTKSMTQHMDKLTKISKAATTGGVILAGVGLASSCYQISLTESKTEKNEIAVSTIASTTTGVVIGSIATVLLVGTPVGWGIILAVGTGSALASWAMGEVSKNVYKTQFADTDVVNSLGINQFCN